MRPSILTDVETHHLGIEREEGRAGERRHLTIADVRIETNWWYRGDEGEEVGAGVVLVALNVVAMVARVIVCLDYQKCLRGLVDWVYSPHWIGGNKVPDGRWVALNESSCAKGFINVVNIKEHVGFNVGDLNGGVGCRGDEAAAHPGGQVALTLDSF